MLNGIHLVDFANHRDTELRFGKFTALVGQNGAGKTNVMRGILQIREALYRDDVELAELRQFQRNPPNYPKIVAGWHSEYHGDPGDFGVEIRSWGSSWFWRNADPEDKSTWIPSFTPDAPREKVRRVRNIQFDEDPEDQPGKIYSIKNDNARLNLDGWNSIYFKLNGEQLRGPSYTEVTPPMLLENGSEFAWTLAYLMTAEPERFREIVEALKIVVPVVRNVRARPVRLARIERKTVTINKQERSYDEEQAVMGQELIFDMVSGKDLPAAFVSDGTLVVLAILTAIMQGNAESSTVLLDDIEQGLHPKAQRELIRQLRKLQEIRPGLQIIVSSHSPYIIDELSPEDVWLFAPDEEGCAAYARLSDHPDIDKALKILTTGEFWSSEGEDWVLGTKNRDTSSETESLIK